MLPALVCLALLAGPAQPGQGVPSPPPPGEGPVILFLVDNSASLPPLDPEAERVIFERLKQALEAEKPLRQLDLSEEDKGRLRGYALLSGKPMLLVANLGEADIKQAAAWLERSGLLAFASQPGLAVCAVAAPIEAEMAELAPEDAQAFRDDLGLAEPGLDRVIRSTYELLGLISFLTAGEDECRAWTIRRGSRVAS